jgi:hypothetical protein
VHGQLISEFVITLIYRFYNVQCSIAGSVAGSSYHTSSVAVELGEMLVTKMIQPDDQVFCREDQNLMAS